MTVHARSRHPALAAGLSFLFPGLGQAYAGDRTLAAVLAAPVFVLLVGGAAVGLLFGGELRNQLLSSAFLVGVLLLDVALLGWRLFAILHAGLAGAPDRRPRRLLAIAALVLLTIAMHAYVGFVVIRLNAALDQVFSGSASRVDTGGRGPVADAPLNEPEYRWDGTDRLNFLLLGIDAAPGRDHALTDTILVASIDPVGREAVMVSIPRDTGSMPLPDTSVFADGLFPRKVNALTTEAATRPEMWCPDLDPTREAVDCGIRTLQRSVGLYLGIEIHHYALVDLTGFTELIDAVGGVEICLRGRLSDPDYVDPETGERGITIHDGCRRLDGSQALAYARIRTGVIVLPDDTIERQDDFKRAERQQEVLLALRRELAASDLVFELPGLLDAIASTVSTDFSRSKAGDLASLVPLIAGPNIERVVLGLPDFVDPPVDPAADYLLIPRRDAIRAEAERLFGADGPLLGWYVGSDRSTPDDSAGGTEDDRLP